MNVVQEGHASGNKSAHEAGHKFETGVPAAKLSNVDGSFGPEGSPVDEPVPNLEEKQFGTESPTSLCFSMYISK